MIFFVNYIFLPSIILTIYSLTPPKLFFDSSSLTLTPPLFTPTKYLVYSLEPFLSEILKNPHLSLKTHFIIFLN